MATSNPLAPASLSGRRVLITGREIGPHSLIDLDKTYRAGDLLNIIRGRTFWKGDSACFVKDGKKYLVRIGIEEAGPA